MLTIHHTGSTRLAVTGRHALLARTQAGSIHTLTILQVVSRQAVTLAGCGDGDTLITTHPGVSQTLITTEYQAWQTLTITGLTDRLALTLADGEVLSLMADDILGEVSGGTQFFLQTKVE